MVEEREHALALVFVIFISSSLNLAAICWGPSSPTAWDFVVPVMSLWVSLLFLILEKGQAGFCDKLHYSASLFFVIWWAVGVISQNFFGPFQATGNGYFSGWICFIMSYLYALKYNDFIKNLVSDAASDEKMGLSMEEGVGQKAEEGGFSSSYETLQG